MYMWGMVAQLGVLRPEGRRFESHSSQALNQPPILWMGKT